MKLLRLFQHRHTLKPLDVQHMRSSLFAAAGATLVLHRCTQCGDHTVETLEGHWAPGLFIPRPPEVLPEAAFVPMVSGGDHG